MSLGDIIHTALQVISILLVWMCLGIAFAVPLGALLARCGQEQSRPLLTVVEESDTESDTEESELDYPELESSDDKEDAS